MTSKEFCVVVFDEMQEVDVVPSVWLSKNEKKCRWPPYKDSQKTRKAVKEQVIPGESWSTYPVRVLGFYDTYSAANCRVKRAEETSDLQSEAEQGRGQRRLKPSRRLYEDTESSDSSGDTLEMQPCQSTIPKPPRVSDFPSLQRSNAFCTPKIDRTTYSDQSKTNLLALARIETRMEDQTKLLEQVMATQQDMLHQLLKMQSVSSSSSSGGYDFAEVDDVLPIETLQAFDALEGRLASDQEFKKLMVQRLKVLGGSTLKVAVKAILDTVMSNTLQQKFNWEGKKCWKTKENFTKIGFKSTKLCQVVCGVLLRKPQFSTDEKEIGQAVMKYLRCSGDRCGGRAQRLKFQSNDSSQDVLSDTDG